MSARILISTLVVAAATTAALTISVGGAARPALTCAGETATILGTAGPDRIVGTPGNDVIVGLGGDDCIHGAGGRDVICGRGGNDLLDGGREADELYGGRGDDRLTGGPGGIMGAFHRTDWETLIGGPGRDELAVRDLYPNPYPSTPAEDRCFRGKTTVACPTFHPGWIVE
jgi:Ca2+-binding RTX toxin-like protein